MSDFFSLRIRGRHGRYSVAPFEAHLPAFRWRQGDSDAQGPYVSGSRPDGVHIKFWWGEQPHDLTVSFRSSAADAAERDRLMAQIREHLVPALGEVVEA